MTSWYDYFEFVQDSHDLFDAIEGKVFTKMMEHLAPINRTYPHRSDELTSFILTRTIGVMVNGGSLGVQLPSRMLKAEQVLAKAFEVSLYAPKIRILI